MTMLGVPPLGGRVVSARVRCIPHKVHMLRPLKMRDSEPDTTLPISHT